MIKLQAVFVISAGLWLSCPQFFAQGANAADQSRVIVTVLPSDPSVEDAHISQQDLAVKVNGKQVTATGWTPLRSDQDQVEIVILIDGSARSSLGTQFGEISRFVGELPTKTKMAIGYMENGRAVLEVPLSANPAQVTGALHAPAGAAGVDSSPYFSLSDLARHWPSSQPDARRVAVLVTDGVDNFGTGNDVEDPYVEAAIKDSVQAGLQVYSIYWRVRGNADQSLDQSTVSQSLISEVTAATGGHSYWQGTSNPVSFEPYFNDLRRRLRNQYALSFTAPAVKKPELANLELKSGNRSAKIEAPREVWIGRTTESSK